MPRPNLYQSLHTTVIHAGQAFEVQIRTQEMHASQKKASLRTGNIRMASLPVMTTAHHLDAPADRMVPGIAGARRISHHTESGSHAQRGLRLYAQGPRARIPAGATPVDFAYAVHTEVGHQCVGAKINGQMVALRHEISSGDVVEILTQKAHGPSRDWLSFVKSSVPKAKSATGLTFMSAKKPPKWAAAARKESRAFGRSLKKIEEAELQKAAADYGLSKVEDLFAAVALGNIPRAKCSQRSSAKASSPPMR
jgi:GTP pyrophosphokinase